MTDLNYELAPRQGMSANQRKSELDAARFVAVRNLAYMMYKKPDNSPLMTYQETLDNRELVKTAIINYEIAAGLLVNDLGAVAAPPSQQPAMQVVPQNGAQMNHQSPPMQFAPPPQQQQVSPAQFAQMPMAPQQQQPQYAPQPQQQFAPPPQMQPQQFAQQPQQMAPAAPAEVAAPTGKKRRAASGSSVAPPPAPPGAQYSAPPGMQQPVPVQQFMQPMTAPQQVQQPMQFAPPPFQAQAPQQQVPQQAPQVGGIDLGPVLTRVDDLGKGLMIAANNADAASKGVAALKADLDELKSITMQLLTAMHHMYLTNQQLGTAANGQATKLNDFRSYLQKYIGSPS